MGKTELNDVGLFTTAITDKKFWQYYSPTTWIISTMNL
jgi:hypothetical protein